MTPNSSKNYLKWLSLIILVIQNATTILLLRYVRTADGDKFFSTTAIVCQELIKMIASVFLLFTESYSFTELYNSINQQILKNPFDSIKTGIPAFLFTIQTNLIYLAISNLNAAVFQVTFQIKILTTALFMVLLLKRSLKLSQWFSLVLLTLGVAIIQIQNVSSSSSSGDDNKNAMFGFFCVVVACILSGLAGVFFEKILKHSKVSIWVRNIQLGLFGTLFALITAYTTEYENIQAKGFFFGYNHLVWANILIQSAGGLLVAVVIKYADNILKGFATSIAIIVSCLASSYLFGTKIDLIFTVGTLLVVLSVMLYSYVPPSPQGSLLPSSNSASSSSLVSKSDESGIKINLDDNKVEALQFKIDQIGKSNVVIDLNSKASSGQ